MQRSKIIADQQIEKWSLTDKDAETYCERVELSLDMDGSAFCVHAIEGFTNIQECPCGFADTAFNAICDFYSQIK